MATKGEINELNRKLRNQFARLLDEMPEVKDLVERQASRRPRKGRTALELAEDEGARGVFAMFWDWKQQSDSEVKSKQLGGDNGLDGKSAR